MNALQKTLAAMLLIFFITTMSSLTGQFNTQLIMGDVAPKWTDLDGVDGAKHSSDE